MPVVAKVILKRFSLISSKTGTDAISGMTMPLAIASALSLFGLIRMRENKKD